jgi:hypothetical protein
MDGHPRQNPAYRSATEKALVTGLFLWTRFAGDSSGAARGGLDCGLRGNRSARSPGVAPWAVPATSRSARGTLARGPASRATTGP